MSASLQVVLEVRRPLGIGEKKTDQGRSPVVCNLETEFRSNVNPECQHILVFMQQGPKGVPFASWRLLQL